MTFVSLSSFHNYLLLLFSQYDGINLDEVAGTVLFPRPSQCVPCVWKMPETDDASFAIARTLEFKDSFKGDK